MPQDSGRKRFDSDIWSDSEHPFAFFIFWIKARQANGMKQFCIGYTDRGSYRHKKTMRLLALIQENILIVSFYNSSFPFSVRDESGKPQH